MKQKIMNMDQAVELIPSGATVTICASSGVLTPDKTLEALGQRYENKAVPTDLTIVLPIAVGDGNSIPGLERLAQKGMLKRLIGGSFSVGGKEIYRMITENEVEAYNLPQGVIMHLLRDIAAKKPGVITKVGIGSFVDPYYGGGKLNEITRDDLVKHLDINGDDWLFYESFPIDVAIIRATSADEYGNLSMEKEAAYLGVLHQALAAKNSGGIVIAQVERVVKGGSLALHSVKVPGMLVDAIVVAPNQEQSTMAKYDPSLSGEIKIPLNQLTQSNPIIDAKKIIARRAIMEFYSGWAINVGFGTADIIPLTVHEEGLDSLYTFLIEQGAIGGTPVPGAHFGVMWNPMAMLDSSTMFDLLDGGGFDLTCLASAQIDSKGSVVVHRLPGMLPGCGGFLDIIENVKRIIFCGTFTSGGFKAIAEKGALKIIKEGSIKKFINSIDGPTFNAQRGWEKKQEVMYVTERAVFRLTDKGLELIEVAPGIDIEHDILNQMEFSPIISNPKLMDSKIFENKTSGKQDK